MEESVPSNSSFTAAHIWLLACQTQIIANIVQFAFVLFTMAKEEKVKENGGRGLPLSLQSLQGGSTVDTGEEVTPNLTPSLNLKSYYIKLVVCMYDSESVCHPPSIIFCLSVTSYGQTENQD